MPEGHSIFNAVETESPASQYQTNGAILESVNE